MKSDLMCKLLPVAVFVPARCAVKTEDRRGIEPPCPTRIGNEDYRGMTG
jgi:hypothetical protein